VAAPRLPRSPVGVAARSDRSIPAQNAPPAPVTTTAFATGSAAAVANAVANSASSANVMALRFSGRSIVMTATSSVTS
jgi:hypothetical protein